MNIKNNRQKLPFEVISDLDKSSDARPAVPVNDLLGALRRKLIASKFCRSIYGRATTTGGCRLVRCESSVKVEISNDRRLYGGDRDWRCDPFFYPVMGFHNWC